MLWANHVRKIADQLGQMLLPDAAVLDPVVDRGALDTEVFGNGRLRHALEAYRLLDGGTEFWTCKHCLMAPRRREV